MARERQLTTPDLTKTTDTGVAPPFLCCSSDRAMLRVCVFARSIVRNEIARNFIALADNCQGY